MAKTFDEELLRKELCGLLVNKSHTLVSLAKELRITRPTLMKFLKDKGEVTFITLLKIEEYIDRRGNAT